MGHVVLLGDSIFDNASYVPDGPSVIEHLKRHLPDGWNATLLAEDGAVVEDVLRQLRHTHADATHLVISVGGNDVLRASGAILEAESGSPRQILMQLAGHRDRFRSGYADMLLEARLRQLPTTICTIYDQVPGLGPAERTGLALFNEVILREAVRYGVDLIDLRQTCMDRDDYSALSPIEPSAAGGAKIARAIAAAVAATRSGGAIRLFV